MCNACDTCELKNYLCKPGSSYYSDIKLQQLHMPCALYSIMYKLLNSKVIHKNNINLYKILSKKNFEEHCYFDYANYIYRTYMDTSIFRGLPYKNVILLLIDYLYWSYGEPFSKDNFLLKGFERKNTIISRRNIKQKYKEGKVNVRTGQKTFKKDLLKLYGKCQLCDIGNPSLLIASHIKPYLDSKLDECIDFNNGLLLCPNHDKLFDKKLISFDDDGKILISDKLSKDDVSKLDILNKKIRVFQEQKKYLKWHREHLI